jgi:hypothetical protein
VFCDTITKPQEPDRSDRVCRHDEAESRLAKLRRALEHDRLDASTLERDRGRQSADTRSDDNCPHARSVRRPAGTFVVFELERAKGPSRERRFPGGDVPRMARRIKPGARAARTP